MIIKTEEGPIVVDQNEDGVTAPIVLTTDEDSVWMQQGPDKIVVRLVAVAELCRAMKMLY